jgi:hypothetical protein
MRIERIMVILRIGMPWNESKKYSNMKYGFHRLLP